MFENWASAAAAYFFSTLHLIEGCFELGASIMQANLLLCPSRGPVDHHARNVHVGASNFHHTGDMSVCFALGLQHWGGKFSSVH